MLNKDSPFLFLSKNLIQDGIRENILVIEEDGSISYGGFRVVEPPKLSMDGVRFIESSANNRKARRAEQKKINRAIKCQRK